MLMREPTESVFVRQGRDNTCREVLGQMCSQENEILEPSSRGGIRCREYGQIRLRMSFRVNRKERGASRTNLCRHKIRDICVLRLRQLLDGILYARNEIALPPRFVWVASIFALGCALSEARTQYRGRGALVRRLFSRRLPGHTVKDVLLIPQHVAGGTVDGDGSRARRRDCAVTEAAKVECVVHERLRRLGCGATSDRAQLTSALYSRVFLSRSTTVNTFLSPLTDRHGLQMVMAPCLFLASRCVRRCCV